MNYKDKVPDSFKNIDELSKKEAETEIKKLRKAIEHHNYLYYVENQPKISDRAFDKLFNRLKKLENKYPEFESETSPTKKVGSKVVDKLQKVEHTKNMLSLNSVNDEDGIKNFFDFINKSVEQKGITYVLEPKFDGLSVEIVYENGNFKFGATRGDGRTGEDISENIKTINTLPLKLRNNKTPSFLAVRGEVFMSKKGFQKINKKRVENGKDPFSNPRNAAAGIMRQHDSKKVADKPLEIIFYEVLKVNDHEFKKHNNKLKQLKEWGLKTSNLSQECSSTEDILNYHKKLSEKRDELDFDIDGIVIKVNDNQLREKLGTRERNPRWAIAYKFEPKKEVTQIKNIVIQVGRTGQLTPIALLDPVDIDGVTVSRASLHNEKEVNKKNLHVGDEIKIARKGDVIPEVIERVNDNQNKNENNFSMPKKCPSCSSKVEKEGAHYFCTGGLACKPQLVGKIMHFASKEAMDIQGLGKETVKMLVANNMVKDISSLYKLKKSDIKKLEGFADKSSNKLYKEINAHKKADLETFIYALGIRQVGRHVAYIIAREFKTLKNIKNADKKDFKNIDEIGPEITESIVNFFNEEKNLEIIDSLFKNGVKIKQRKTYEKSSKLKGKTFVFTGKLNSYTRKEAKKEVKKLGGKTASSVSSNTNYVVAGNNPGQKYENAEQNNVKILNEKEFKELLE